VCGCGEPTSSRKARFANRSHATRHWNRQLSADFKHRRAVAAGGANSPAWRHDRAVKAAGARWKVRAHPKLTATSRFL
jgi:hypothetical protein